MQTIGNRIRSARLQRGLTQQQLAKMLGVSFQMVQHYERGHGLSTNRLATLARVLHVKPKWLLNGPKAPDR